MGKISFNSVGGYEKLGNHAGYVFRAKQWPKKFKRSDDIDFFGGS